MGEIVRPVIDSSRLDALREIDAGLAAEVAAVWVATSPAVVERLFAAAAAGDPTELASAAHALRGSSLNVGADLLAQACAAVETANRAGSDPAPAVEAVRAEFSRAVAALAEVAATG